MEKQIPVSGDNFLVGFLDILGYQDILLPRHGPARNATEIFDAINQMFLAKENLELNGDLARAINQQMLSDSLLLALNLEDLPQYAIEFKVGKFCALCVAAYHAIFQLIGQPIRGCIARGQYYRNSLGSAPGNQFLFSRAMANAYQVESKFADVPRIVIHEEFKDFFLKNEKLKKVIIQDYDGAWIIDVFYVNPFVNEEHRKMHSDLLNRKILNEKDFKIRRKYEYMKNCYNEFVRRNKFSGEITE